MGIYRIDKAKNIIHVGDIHGEFDTFGYMIKQKKITDSVIIQHGDFGMGFEKRSYYDTKFHQISNFLITTKNVVYAIRGNHDDPLYFDGDYNFPNLFLIPDYSVILTPDLSMLCLGGGISIDKSVRTEGVSYWGNEACTYDEDKLKELPSINRVISHDAPGLLGNFYKPGLTQWLAVDPGLQHRLEESNDKLRGNLEWLIRNNHPVLTWVMAHFHKSDVFTESGITFYILNINEFKTI